MFNLGRVSSQMDSVYVNDIDRAAVPAFRGIFGKTYDSMSKKELKAIIASLKECTNEEWAKRSLSQLVTESDLWESLAQKFEREGQDDYLHQLRWKREDEEEQQLKAKACHSSDWEHRQGYEKSYELADLLLETSLYKLYGRWPIPGGCWCDEYKTELVLLYKVDDNYKIVNNADYWKRFDTEILPAIFARCKHTKEIAIYHQILGYVRLPTQEILDRPQPKST